MSRAILTLALAVSANGFVTLDISANALNF